jgi:hypothetical protein
VRRAQRGSSSAAARGPLPFFAAAAAAPVIAYFIVRSAAASMGGTAAAAFAALPPEDPRPRLQAVAAAVQNPRQRVDAGALQLSHEGAAVSPLLHHPYFVAARWEQQHRRIGRAIALMEEVRRRRPAHSGARLMLVAYYGEARRFRDLLRELDMALRLNPEARRVVLPELTKLIADPDGRSALADVLRNEPAWREDFYNAAVARKVSAPDVAALIGAIQARKRGRGLAAERNFYLRTLVAAGQHRQARQLWLASLPATERAAAAYVFDGGFRGVRAPEPFNWVLHDVSAGRAEIVGGAGETPRLAISYFGGSDATLAEQIVALPPGRYTLSLTARSETGVKAGEIMWRVGCFAGGVPLAVLKLEGLAAAPKRYAMSFTVPAGCSGQRLVLAAEPGDIASPVEAEVRALEVKPDA